MKTQFSTGDPICCVGDHVSVRIQHSRKSMVQGLGWVVFGDGGEVFEEEFENSRYLRESYL